MSIERGRLVAAIARIHEAMERESEALNAADSQLGDGDLGVTMTRGMRLVSDAARELPEDLGQALARCAQAFTSSSGSSYGTLLATGLLAMAKAVKGRTEVEPAEISGLVALARDAMMARGKARPGGKTVLDSLDAVATATAGLSDPGEVSAASVRAVHEAMEALRDRPATTGRARIFAEKSRGLDDPGMLAMATIVEAIAG